jgi:hypothetical protein
VRTIFDINLFYDKFIMHTSGRELCSLFWVPTVIVKCRTAIKVVFLHLILLLSAMLDIQIHLHPHHFILVRDHKTSYRIILPTMHIT